MMLASTILMEGVQKKCLRKQANTLTKKNCYFEKDCNKQRIFSIGIFSLKNEGKMKHAKLV